MDAESFKIIFILAVIAGGLLTFKLVRDHQRSKWVYGKVCTKFPSSILYDTARKQGDTLQYYSHTLGIWLNVHHTPYFYKFIPNN